MYELKIIKHFAAAHQLTLENSKCENLHGHNWKVELYVKGKEIDENNLLIDFSILKQLLEQILNDLDHTFLNKIDYFNNSPSSEIIAKYIAEKMENLLIDYPLVNVSHVTAWESENACSTYYFDE